MFTDVDIVVDGALESSDRFYDEAYLNFTLELECEDARQSGLPVEIYITFHEHSDHDEEMDDCACIQYVTDGRPKYVFNMGDLKGSWQ